MNIRVLVVFVLCVTRVKSAKKLDINAYCKLSCKSMGGKDTPNTVCKYKLKAGSKCTDVLPLPFSLEERQYMLDKHNEMRHNVASGNDTRGGNGAAANMMALNYDIELEVPAMAWGMQCEWGHDKCRTTPKFPNAVGQNLYEAAYSKGGHHLDAKQLKISMDVWYVEIVDTTKSLIEKYDMNFKMGQNVLVGHYTQLVWAETTHVGCTRVAYKRPKSKKPYVVYILCNYGPSGNYHTRPVYKFGAPVTMCPSGTKANTKYPALCGEIKKITSDTLLPDTIGAARSIMSKYLLTLLAFVGCLAQSFKTWV